MKFTAFVLAFCSLVVTHAACASKGCMMTALQDTHPEGDPTSVWRKGVRDGPVTEIAMNKRTGRYSFCLHGGYCYLAFVSVNGREVEALHMNNCRKQPNDAGYDDGENITYGIEAIPMRSPSVSIPAEPKDIQAVHGECQEESSAAAAPLDQPLTRYRGQFHCDGAEFFFHDNNNQQVTIWFIDSRHIDDAPVLGFSGTVQENGTKLKVTGLYYMDANSRPLPVTTDSSCSMRFTESGPTELHCVAFHQSGTTRYMGMVHFIATRQ